MLKKITFLLIIIATISAGIFTYLTIHKSPASSTQTAPPKPETVDDALNNSNTVNSAAAPENAPLDTAPTNQPTQSEQPAVSDSTTGSTEKVSPVKEVKGNTLAHITPEHCDNDCTAFKIDLKLYEYCQQACGISPVQKVTTCDDKKGLEKDYCLKDLAIGRTDISLCENIQDANIVQSCKNRIMQDIIENQ